MNSTKNELSMAVIADKKLTTPEFAESFKVTPQTVRKNFCITGECYGLKPIKIGNRLLWSASQVAERLKVVA